MSLRCFPERYPAETQMFYQEQRKAENEGVTEDDVNEIKNDISAFRWVSAITTITITITIAITAIITITTCRFELIEIMRASGMNTENASGPAGPGGKKNR